MFDCRDVLAELSSYLDDDLAADMRRELETHLAHCRTCRALYDSSRKTLRIVTDSGTFELPEGTSTRLLDRLKARLRAVEGEREPPGEDPSGDGGQKA